MRRFRLKKSIGKNGVKMEFSALFLSQKRHFITRFSIKD